MTFNVWLLMITGALAMSTAPMMVFIGGLIGAELAPSIKLATLPVALMVVGTVCNYSRGYDDGAKGA